MPDVVILGGPGDGVVVAQTLRDIERADGSMRPRGFLNDALELGTRVYGLSVLGRLDEWSALPEDTLFVAALHKIKQMYQRMKRIDALGIPPPRWASVVHPTARVADDVYIGFGSFIAAYVVTQPGVAIGTHVSIRAGANLGHELGRRRLRLCRAQRDFVWQSPSRHGRAPRPERSGHRSGGRRRFVHCRRRYCSDQERSGERNGFRRSRTQSRVNVGPQGVSRDGADHSISPGSVS